MTQPGRLTTEQWNGLLKPLDRSHVEQNPSGQSYIPQWDVRAQLIRIFGFGGFDIETLELEQISEFRSKPSFEQDGTERQSYVSVVYRAQVRLIIKDPQGRELARWDDAAAGSSTGYRNPTPKQTTIDQAYHNAMTGALSTALNRCVNNLGDQFGLSLYNKGSVDPVVGSTLLDPPATIPAPRESEDEILQQHAEGDQPPWEDETPDDQTSSEEHHTP